MIYDYTMSWHVLVGSLYYTWIILDQGYTVDSVMFIDVNLAHSLHTMKANIQLDLVTVTINFIAPVLGYIMIILTDTPLVYYSHV